MDCTWFSSSDSWGLAADKSDSLTSAGDGGKVLRSNQVDFPLWINSKQRGGHFWAASVLVCLFPVSLSLSRPVSCSLYLWKLLLICVNIGRSAKVGRDNLLVTRSQPSSLHWSHTHTPLQVYFFKDTSARLSFWISWLKAPSPLQSSRYFIFCKESTLQRLMKPRLSFQFPVFSLSRSVYSQTIDWQQLESAMMVQWWNGGCF